MSSSDDFLFHLYRGAELLQEDSAEEAKEELERALALQPSDAGSQALLGAVYFRLGVYPRAIEIFREVVASHPHEIAPRMNLGLCLLKTGMLQDARQEFENVVRQNPGHRRAWGYLGLTYQRLGDLEKAKVAFQRASREALAERISELIREQRGEPAGDEVGVLEMREAMAAAEAELDRNEPVFQSAADAGRGATSASGTWRALELGRPNRVALGERHDAEADGPRSARRLEQALPSRPEIREPALGAGAPSAASPAVSVVPAVRQGSTLASLPLAHRPDGPWVYFDRVARIRRDQVVALRGVAAPEPVPATQWFDEGPLLRVDGPGSLLLDAPGVAVHVVDEELIVRKHALLALLTDHVTAAPLSRFPGLLRCTGAGPVALALPEVTWPLVVTADEVVLVSERAILAAEGRVKLEESTRAGWLAVTGHGTLLLSRAAPPTGWAQPSYPPPP